MRNGLRKNLNMLVAATTLVLAMPPAPAAESEPTADQVVGAIETAFGVTPGQRRNHTKGSCVVGEFVGTPAAAAYSRSQLFSGQPVPLVGRFSIAGGNPKVPDATKNPRGMALEFRLPNGDRQHFTMLNIPMFGAARPRTFLDLMVAIKPEPATGKPDPEKIRAFKDSHPDNRPQLDFLASHNPPVSFANSAYFGIHTFRFIGRGDKVTPVRWRFIPEDGEKRLTDAELKSAPQDFLEQALIERTKKGPVRWDMIVTLGQPGDAETDPTKVWPPARKEFKAGTLTISAAMPQRGAQCEAVNFDPLVMSDGIAPTDDPILLFRSPAYAISFAKRITGH